MPSYPNFSSLVVIILVYGLALAGAVHAVEPPGVSDFPPAAGCRRHLPTSILGSGMARLLPLIFAAMALIATSPAGSLLRKPPAAPD